MLPSRSHNNPSAKRAGFGAATLIATVALSVAVCYAVFLLAGAQQQRRSFPDVALLAAAGAAGGGDKLELALAQMQQRLDDISGALKRDAAPPLSTKEFEVAAALTAGKLDGIAAAVAACQSPPDASSPRLLGAPKAGEAATPPSGPATTARPRNAVVGMAKGIELANAYRFVRSLRTVAPDAEIVIFTDDAAGNLGWMYSAFGVRVETFNVGEFPPKVQKFHPSSYRWMLIRDWMRGLPAAQRFDNVLFIDVRDSVFQSDPFEFVAAKPGFYAFLEAKPRTIRECGWNSGWVSDCFGADALAKVGDKVISCSGTSMGSWDDMLKYAVMVGDEVESNACERNGVDQGMHNYFLYAGNLEKAVSALHIISNEEGWIATVQSMPGLTRDRAGRLLNNNGKPYAIVHQYDRSPQLLRQYGSEYVWLDDSLLNQK